MNRNVLVLLCGPAFSGKSTLAAALARRGARVVSFDETAARRGLRPGRGITPEEAEGVHRACLAEVDERMRRGEGPLVLDDTSCYRFLRDDYREVAARNGYALRLAVLETPEREIRFRIRTEAVRSWREGIDPDVFEHHLATFEWPGPDEPHHSISPRTDPESWIDELLRG